MKLEAHPLLVAVALGLLGPGVLEEDDTEEVPCSGCGDDDKNAVAEWEPGEAPDPEEFHRVEIEWLKHS
jgi:hypothetical protein